MKNENSKIKNKKHIGFTLLETLVAIGVFMMAIAGPMTLATYSMRSLSVGRNQIIAYYLAEDALEFVKNYRDTNKLKGVGWTDGLENCMKTGVNKRCYIDTVGGDLTECNVMSSCDVEIKYDSSAGFYNYSSGVSTGFVRNIRIEEIADHYPSPGGDGNDDEARVVVEVSWEEKFVPKSFTLEGYIFDI